MRNFFLGLNHARNGLKHSGKTSFLVGQLINYSSHYDEIVAKGFEQNKTTKGTIARKEEKTLLNRLVKYKENHLLFIYDFKVHYSNNISEKDLRICKNRQKMAGGFRNADGRRMYCDIMSFIETIKRRGLNIFRSIIRLMTMNPLYNNGAIGCCRLNCYNLFEPCGFIMFRYGIHFIC